MYAQCPHCQTVFRVRAEQLRTARGQVRCSRCDDIFDALQTLREDVPASQPVADTPPTPVRDPDTPGDLFAEQSLTQNEELHLPGTHTEDDDKTLRLHDQDRPPSQLNQIPDTPSSDSTSSEPLQTVNSRQSVGSNLLKKPYSGLFLGFLLLLLLSAQLVHANREALASIDWLAGPLRTTYANLGLEMPPPRVLTQLAILDVEIISHPTLPGVLQLNAVLANEARFAQAWPVLKVRLEDRWGAPVGQRYFSPKDYLGQPPQTLLPAHENTVISLSLVDPGKSAVGFIVNTCLANNGAWQCRDQLTRDR